jgi:hypothetical protein
MDFVFTRSDWRKEPLKFLKKKTTSPSMEVTSHQLQCILEGIVLSSVKKRVRYKHHFVDKNPVVAGVSGVL